MTTRTTNEPVRPGSQANRPAAPAEEAARVIPEGDPFRYGWRYVRRTLPDGTETLEQVPLTLEDVLHPQENDVIPERPIQEQERGDLARIFRSRLPRDTSLVLSDCLVDWGVPGIRNSSPDVSVFADLKVQHDPERGTYRLKPSGGRCVLSWSRRTRATMTWFTSSTSIIGWECPSTSL